MTIPTTDLPPRISHTTASLYLCIFAFVPMVVILQTWTEQATPRGIGLRACAWAITKRAILGIGVFELLVGIVYFQYRDQYVTYWNIAAGSSVVPLLGIYGGLAVFGLLWSACWHFPALGVRNKMALARVSEHLRGTLVIDGSKEQQKTTNYRADSERGKKPGNYLSTIRFAGLNMPTAAEMLHTLILGTTGTGKSVTIGSAMSDIAERAKYSGERMMILDPDGGYAARYGNAERGDRFLNPFDACSAKWAMFKEIRRPYDADNIAAALVPDPGGEAGEWARKARAIVSSVIEVLAKVPGAESCDLYKVCCLTTVPELREVLANTPAARFLEEGNDRTMLSILTTVTDALSALRYLEPGDNFSITEWVREGRGWLFVPYDAEQIAALSPLIRTWVRIAIFSALSLPERDNGLWFVMDEFDALGKLEGLADALPRLRKVGGRVILGLQTIGMVERLYGQGYADAIAENAGNKLILRCSSGKSNGDGTSKFASHLIGQHQVRRAVQSTNTSSGSGRNPGGESSNRGTGSSTSEQIVIEDAVMPAEIEQLPNLTGYLKFATQPEWRRVTFPIDGVPITTEP
jgi:type IV secretory pathway TraG/TraD family ATPase VirD4